MVFEWWGNAYMHEFNQEEFNKFVIENNVYGFFDEPITLASGRKSHFYANFRSLVQDAWLTDSLTDYLISFAKDKGLDVDTFYGVPEGATKIGLIAQYKLAKESDEFSEGSHVLAMGRGKPKEHGAPKDKFFVGVPQGKVVVIEDVTTTGSSLITTIKSLKEAGVDVVGVVSLSNRMEKRDDGDSVKQAIKKLGVSFFSMSSALDILPLMYKKSKPSETTTKSIESEFEECGVEQIKLR